MHKIVLFLTLLLLPAAASALQQEVSFTLNGTQRDYILYVPDNLPKDRAAPLVLVLHGGGGSSTQILRSSGGRFNELADAHGFVVVYGNAVRRIWDLQDGAISEGLRSRQDDLAYFETVIAQVSATRQIDQARIFVTGMSRGGQASYFLACKRPDLIRAFAPVAMSLPVFLQDDCREMRQTGFAVINGTADPIVPYAGGQIDVLGKSRDTVLGTEETFRIMAAKNRCSGTNLTKIGAVDRIEGTGCRTPTVLYRVNGGGHAWPGDTTRRKLRQGGVNSDINAANAIWAFFSRF